MSYGVFFATFDITRRLGLRVKALFGGQIQPGWDNFISFDSSDSTSPESTSATSSSLPTYYRPDNLLAPSSTPTRARVAQAVTIVTGGVTASILAELAGRPFRTCQRVMTAHAPPSATLQPMAKWQHPIYELYRTEGLSPFFRREGVQPISANALDAIPSDRNRAAGTRLKRVAMRVGWRVAAVGPWGLGFLCWSWAGGEL